MTPRDRFTDLSFREGVQLGSRGEPVPYRITNPSGRQISRSMTSDQFRLIPTRIGHRPGIFHVVVQKEDEQVPGVRALKGH